MSASPWIGLKKDCPESDAASFGPESQRYGSWQDLSLPLSLPERQVAALHDISDRMTGRCSEKAAIAIFTGCDAAGKLMAAEALAYEIQRPLFRVERSEFIGLSLQQTIEQLARTLDRAHAEKAILMFDLSGDLPDAFLRALQSYPGLSILAMESTQSASMVLRRSIHFIVDFPFPFDNE